MPSPRHHQPGDLFVKFHVKFPDHIDAAAISHLEQALPPRNPIEKFPKNILMEEIDLSDLDARQQKAANMRSEEAMDEDEDQPRVQCANQ